MDNGNSETTCLITLLNVSAVKSGKRKSTFDTSVPVKKLNKKRKSVPFTYVSKDLQKPASPNFFEMADEAVQQAEVRVEQEDLTEELTIQNALVEHTLIHLA